MSAAVEEPQEPKGDPEKAEPVVAMFEGELVTEMEGKLNPIIFEMPDGYPRNTVLRMQIEVHVKNVRHEEIKGGLKRQHNLALDSISLIAAYQPHEADDSVGGSASSKPSQTPEQAEELGGVTFGRTSDLWGKEAVKVNDPDPGF